MKAIHIGTRGYDHNLWVGGFYDADLPSEWRFAYYCNQFRAVLLPAGPSLSFIAGKLKELLDDSDVDFHLVLELPVEGLDIPNAITALKAFGPRLAGIVFSQLGQGSTTIRSRDAVSLLTLFAANWPICVDATSSNPIDQKCAEAVARELGVSLLWRPEHDAAMTARGGLLVARMGAASLTRMREVLELLANDHDGDRQTAIFFDHIETAVEQARQCRVIAELMGV